jgi:hypothetical protein
MATTSNQVDVQGAAILVVPAGNIGGPSGGNRFSGPSRFVTVKNIGPAVAFIGGTDVTANNGVPINAGGAFGFWLAGPDELWAATDGSAATVSYIETGGSFR